MFDGLNARQRGKGWREQCQLIQCPTFEYTKREIVPMGGAAMIKNKYMQYDTTAINRLLIQARIKNAKTVLEQDLMQAILYLYERGDLEVSLDPVTGQILYKPTEVN
jgi:hypothetical protein